MAAVIIVVVLLFATGTKNVDFDEMTSVSLAMFNPRGDEYTYTLSLENGKWKASYIDSYIEDAENSTEADDAFVDKIKKYFLTTKYKNGTDSTKNTAPFQMGYHILFT